MVSLARAFISDLFENAVEGREVGVDITDSDGEPPESL